MKIRFAQLLSFFFLGGCESHSDLSETKAIDGLFCNVNQITCICYEFSIEGSVEFSYGSSVGRHGRANGVYSLNNQDIVTNVKSDSGKNLEEELKYRSINIIEISDNLLLEKTNIKPVFCAGS